MDRTELAASIVAARNRLTPADVGLPAGRSRRVAGLRREEVALLAGISVDYLIRLEQARGPVPSTQVLGSLSRALRLTDDERDHLFRLAGAPPPADRFIVGTIRPSTQRLIDRLTDLPVLLLDAKGDVLSWNEMASALLGDLSVRRGFERNFIWQRFLGPAGRVSLEPGEWEQLAAESVADLRGVAARYPDDPGLLRLLAELRGKSPEFREMWTHTRVAERRSSRKSVQHPEVGRLTLDCESLQLTETDQRVVVYSAVPGTPDFEALALLRVLGLQQLQDV